MTLKGLQTMLEVDLLSESRPDWSETGHFSSTDIHRRSLRSSLVFHRCSPFSPIRLRYCIGRTKPVSVHRSAVFPRLQVAPRLRAGLPRGVEQHGSLGDSTPKPKHQEFETSKGYRAGFHVIIGSELLESKTRSAEFRIQTSRSQRQTSTGVLYKSVRFNHL